MAAQVAHDRISALGSSASAVALTTVASCAVLGRIGWRPTATGPILLEAAVDALGGIEPMDPAAHQGGPATAWVGNRRHVLALP